MAATSTIASSLVGIFLFNPNLGNEDTESRKILYYYPPSHSLNQQKDYVGLCEGIIAFTKEFSPNQPVEAIASNQHRYSCLEVEPDYWSALCH
jgi:hypothetical protein